MLGRSPSGVETLHDVATAMVGAVVDVETNDGGAVRDVETAVVISPMWRGMIRRE